MYRVQPKKDTVPLYFLAHLAEGPESLCHGAVSVDRAK